MSSDSHSSQREPQAAYIAELQSRYAQTGPGGLISEADIGGRTEIVGSTRRYAYDVLAQHLAIGFHERATLLLLLRCHS